MSEFTVMVLRFAFFALLWLFIFLVAGVLRQDLFGPRRRFNRAQRRRSGSRSQQSAAPPAPAPGPPATPQSAPPRAAPSQQPPPQAPRELHITTGSLAGMIVALGTGPITLGRSGDNTVVLDDDFASSHHARIVPDRGQWYVEDLGSTNGTFIHQQRLTSAVPMRVGTPVTIGHTSMELRP